MDGTGDHTDMTSLGLEVTRPGRRGEPLNPVVVRPLKDADLALLTSNRGTSPVSVKKLSQRHHNLARLIAAGVSSGEAAVIMRYDAGRVSVLLSDPAFAELVRFYQHNGDIAHQATMDQIRDLSADAIEILQTRLEEDPDGFEVKELLEILTRGLDRTGHGPTTTQNHNHTVEFGSRLDAARERAKRARLVPNTETIPDAEIVPEESK